MSTYTQVWNLENIFQGGSDSPALQREIEALTKGFSELKQQVMSFTPHTDDAQWSQVVEELQQLGGRYKEASSFIGCLMSQNIKDERAKQLSNVVDEIAALYSACKNVLQQQLAKIPEEKWTSWRKLPSLNSVWFTLHEMREQAKDKLPIEQEELIGSLSIDGYHAWWEMYNTIVGRIQVEVEQDGETKLLSIGQLSNQLSDPDRDFRLQMFKKWEDAWEEQAGLCSTVLNHIAGYRLQLYKHRKWENVLKEPLEQNRMEESTLSTMWRVITKAKHRLLPYLERKASLLGIDRCHWVDVHAPLPGQTSKVSYDEGARFIIEQFDRLNPDMAAFAKKAFEQRWIEAEDRPGKRPGGFMTDFPVAKESRIFMTYSGTPRCVSTLAHELGHAYHTYVMKDLPLFAQRYAMNVAETASTFAEMMVVDASIRSATSKEEKIALLSQKIESAISFMMDIHSRFLFETRFYEARKQGPVGTEQLCALMTEAQREGFSESLQSYHPHFWASKLHFYGTDVPFYNFPYSFGYLFSAGIYARAREEGRAFSNRYIKLLRDTASMTTEKLAQKHLGVDLREEAFWKSAVDLVLEDVEEWLTLTQKSNVH